MLCKFNMISTIGRLTTSSIFSGTNWGLPLAIAANLHVPCRIELSSYNGEIEDSLGKGESAMFLLIAFEFPAHCWVLCVAGMLIGNWIPPA